MYLFRAPNCTYYTRICLPKSLRDLGFPFDLKVSLLTKNREEAIDRNFILVPQLRELIHNALTFASISEFKARVDDLINSIRESFIADKHEVVHVPIRKTPVQEPQQALTPKPTISLSKAHSEFIESKRSANLRPISLTQLEQRSRYFLESIDKKSISHVTTADVLLYRDRLYSEGRSYKTNKEYFAAASQFFKWCKQMRYTSENPFSDISISNNNKKTTPDEQRDRWTRNDLSKLLLSREFIEKDSGFKWVTKTQLYGGLRPSEACQLRVADIRKKEDVWCFAILEEGEGQHVKTTSSLRFVPIHGELIKQGFMEYVAERTRLKQGQLFDYRPDNTNQDWSRSYCQQLGRLQTRIGMKPGNRPTAYSFRHTFIDELKQNNVSESLVAQIVGHAHQGITFGRYGKKFSIGKLADAVNLMHID